MGAFTSLIMAACLTASSSIRAFLTLFAICLLSSSNLINGFSIPDNLLGVKTQFFESSNGLIILGVLALLEIINDKMRFFPAISGTLLIVLRPLAAVIAAISVLNLGSLAYNWIGALILGLFLGHPLMAVRSQLINGLNRTVKHSNLSISFAEDGAAALTAFLVFFFPVPVFAFILAACAWAVVLRRTAQPDTREIFAYKSPEERAQALKEKVMQPNGEPSGYGVRNDEAANTLEKQMKKPGKPRL